MKREKERAYPDFLEMIRHAWTYDRMTEAERGRLSDAIRFPLEQNLISGTYAQRWGQFQAVYNAFLAGLGYDGGDWREPNPEAVPF